MTSIALNKIFESYAATLYKAASRIIDKRHTHYEDKVQDLVVLAYEQFLRKANNGSIKDLPLLIHFMKLRKSEVQLDLRGVASPKKPTFSTNTTTTKDGQASTLLTCLLLKVCKRNSVKQLRKAVVRWKKSCHTLRANIHSDAAQWVSEH
jgi:hypothetical protein